MTQIPAKAALAAAAVGLVTLMAGCSTGASAGDGSGNGDCAWVLSYDSRTYERPWPPAISVKAGVHHQGSVLGQGTLKGCADGGAAHGEKTSVYKIDGVPVEQAVISEDNVIGLTDSHHIPEGVRNLLDIPSSTPSP